MALPDFREKAVAFRVTNFREEFHSEIDATEVESRQLCIREVVCVKKGFHYRTIFGSDCLWDMKIVNMYLSIDET